MICVPYLIRTDSVITYYYVVLSTELSNVTHNASIGILSIGCTGFIFFNPLSATCSCDARIGGCRQYGLPILLTSTNQKTLFAPVNLSLMH
jgi:hypothetical protein